jgi:hypothetical protein
VVLLELMLVMKLLRCGRDAVIAVLLGLPC